MSDAENPLHSLLITLGESSHAAYALVSASWLEDDLVARIAQRMPGISNRLRDRLFDSKYAPLSSFAAKIDLAFALGLISQAMCRDLHVVREIRNAFAHARERKHFRSAGMKKLLVKLSHYDAAKDPYAFFGDTISELSSSLKTEINRAELAALLSEPTSNGKSG